MPKFGVQNVSGVDGAAGRFTTDSWIDLDAVSNDLQELEEAAISLWFKTDAGGEQVLFGAIDHSSDPGFQERLRFLLDDGVPVVELRQNDNLLREVRGTAAYNDGEWHHAVLNFDIIGNAFV